MENMEKMELPSVLHFFHSSSCIPCRNYSYGESSGKGPSLLYASRRMESSEKVEDKVPDLLLRAEALEGILASSTLQHKWETVKRWKTLGNSIFPFFPFIQLKYAATFISTRGKWKKWN